MEEPHIVVAGAGSIGCSVGGLLSASGRRVTLFLRERLQKELHEHGLHLTDLAGLSLRIAARQLVLATDPDVLARADIILVTVKSGATREMGQLIAQHARRDAVVVSLQNGIGNAAALKEILPQRPVFAGMVPFNVIALGYGRFHRGTSGAVVIEEGSGQLAQVLRVPHLPIHLAADMRAVLWGKLLLNLNNALNALSGLTLQQQLLDPRWRRILAAQQEEALGLLNLAGIDPWSMGPLPARMLPRLLRLPTPIFRLLARSSVRIDPQARSSMWEDLQRGRPTEIEELQGAVVQLARQVGSSAPVNAHIADLVRMAEKQGRGSPQLRPEDVMHG